MKLTKRANIADKLELDQYDHLVAVCEQAKRDAPTRPSDVYSAWWLLRPYYEAYQRYAQMDAPPEDIFLDSRVSWRSLREKFRLAAEAYKELMDALRVS